MTHIPKLGAPAQRALAAQGIQVLEDFSKYTEKQIADLHGMGPNALSKVKAAMQDANISFKK